jgi:predicted dehydrogenase
MTKLNWGLIGGGEGSQIGPAHRLGAGIDGLFHFAAGALDVDPAKGRAYAQSLGVAEDRAYGDWKEMLAGESKRDDKIDLVTVATPNATHFEITKAFLEGGFHVLCEKPMTMTVEEGEEIYKISKATGKQCAVNFGYSGFSLVRQMKAMIANGDIGKVRLVKAEFAHGFHADAADADNPRVRWRYDPKAAGVSAVLADAGIHALHMACFVTGQDVETISADYASTIASRELEDDAMVNFRMDGGAVGRLWTSAVAIGRMHGLTIQVFGESGGLAWQQEHPNQLYYTPLNGRTQIIERGAGDLYAVASRASRVTIGHSEGMPLAFANIYTDLAEIIRAEKEGRAADPAANLFPRAEDGLRSMASVYAATDSAKGDGRWVNAVPNILK